MPLPMETLLRVQLSPVPTHTILWLEGSMVTAPIDCTSSRSKTGLKVVAPLIDFQTPPLAEPTNAVTLPLSSKASMAAMRPLMAAEPIFRAFRPEMVPESNFTGRASLCAEAIETLRAKTAMQSTRADSLRRLEIIMMEIVLVDRKRLFRARFGRRTSRSGRHLETLVVDGDVGFDL